MSPWKVIDRWGNEIILTEERWHHITFWHPELEGCLEQVLDTVRRGRRRQEPLDPNKYRYYRETDLLLPDYDHIVVIVKLAPDRFVLTAYPIFIGR